MPFGAKKHNPPAVVKAEEPAGGKEKGEATEKVGWSWGALAALEGVSVLNLPTRATSSAGAKGVNAAIS